MAFVHHAPPGVRLAMVQVALHVLQATPFPDRLVWRHVPREPTQRPEYARLVVPIVWPAILRDDARLACLAIILLLHFHPSPSATKGLMHLSLGHVCPMGLLLRHVRWPIVLSVHLVIHRLAPSVLQDLPYRPMGSLVCQTPHSLVRFQIVPNAWMETLQPAKDVPRVIP